MSVETADGALGDRPGEAGSSVRHRLHGRCYGYSRSYLAASHASGTLARWSVAAREESLSR